MHRLKELRLKSGKKQSEIAELLGVTPAALSYYETGKRALDADAIVKLSDLFGVSADYFLGKTDGRKKCVFAGTFDPFTLGHEQTVNESLEIFDEVIIAIMINKNKVPMFTLEERLDIINILYGDNPKIRVVSWDGLAVDLLKKEDTPFYVRGLRNAVDFDYENSDFFASKRLYEPLIEIYLPCKQEFLHISSSMVKNSLLFGKPVDGYVSEKTKGYIVNKFKEKQR